jgi:hypothetical protein
MEKRFVRWQTRLTTLLLAYRVLDTRDGIIECDPDLVEAAAAPPPPVDAAARRLRRPAPQGRRSRWRARRCSISTRPSLKPEGMAAIDCDVITKLSGVTKLELVLVTGPRIRSAAGVQPELSERRKERVRDYLVSKGVAKTRSRPRHGKTQPSGTGMQPEETSRN